MNLPALAHALGGNVSGRNRITCPGPGHSPRDRSLAVLVDSSAREGFVAHSFAGDDPLVCRDYVRARLGLPEPERREPSRSIPRPVQIEDERERSKRALAIWSEARSLTGTPGESYLGSRGLNFAALQGSDALKWHPECPFGGERVGCMVALVRDIVTNEPKAIHRTAIDRDGRKRSDLRSNGRLALGPVAGGAVKLSADDDVTLAVAIGEGIESCLSAWRFTDLEKLPIWSLLSAGQVARFPVLPGIETLWIIVDHDDTGLASSEAVRIRWQEADREVITITPTLAGADLNDLTKGPSHA